jgi:hypothetical protein
MCRLFVYGCSFLLLAMGACNVMGAAKRDDYHNCLGCHRGIEKISVNHQFPCEDCHLKIENRCEKPLASHEEIIRNPSDPAHVDAFCMPCHKEDLENLRVSLHSTMAGIINQTRYLWGAQQSAVPALYGLSGPLKMLPQMDASSYPETTGELVDDFLRRRCLRCHIHTAGERAPGLYRSTGCAACHMVYEDDGLYRGDDEIIDKSKPGHPRRHEFSKLIPNRQCLHCHNKNHVGADYEGFFESDYSWRYRTSSNSPPNSEHLYGLEQHRLSKDVHAQKGLWCIDCHTKTDVMGDGVLYHFQMEVPKRTCIQCHGGPDQAEPERSIDAIISAGDGTFHFLLKGPSAPLTMKVYSTVPVAHGVTDHQSVRCSACHSQWSYQDYGLSVIREDLNEEYKWHGLTTQGEPSIKDALEQQMKQTNTGVSFSRDWISGQREVGIWSAGWRYRRWEFMPLGLDHTERFSILRPRYQYYVSYTDRLGNVFLDSVLPERGDRSGRGWTYMPYVPHTTAPFGRSCHHCHLNEFAVGLGLVNAQTIETGLMIPSPPAITSMRLLSSQEQNKLLNPSAKWHRARFRALTNKYSP